jgi:hypothetical protein
MASFLELDESDEEYITMKKQTIQFFKEFLGTAKEWLTK